MGFVQCCSIQKSCRCSVHFAWSSALALVVEYALRRIAAVQSRSQMHALCECHHLRLHSSPSEYLCFGAEGLNICRTTMACRNFPSNTEQRCRGQLAQEILEQSLT